MNSPTEQHLGAAFNDLVAEQPFTPDVSAIEYRARQARRVGFTGRIGRCPAAAGEAGRLCGLRAAASR